MNVNAMLKTVLEDDARIDKEIFKQSERCIIPGFPGTAKISKIYSDVKDIKTRVNAMEAFDVESEDTLLTDGTEQTIILTDYDKAHYLEGYIDLTNLAVGDTIVARLYTKLKSTGAFVKYAEHTFSNVQSTPSLNVVTRIGKYGIKVTLQQTLGTFRNYDYIFFKKPRA